MKFGSLFAGIGGFDLGFEQAGLRCAWQIEKDKYCQKILQANWPGVPKYDDIKTAEKLGSVTVICGGDPCPSRSLAKGNRTSNHPDLSGYFLAVVGRLKPRWVVRENVFASDAVWFVAGVELLGYRVFAIGLDSRDFTSQARRRQFIIGCPPELASGFSRSVLDSADGFGFVSSGSQEETPIAACLTAHPARMAAEDSYCFEPGRGLRLLDSAEAELLQGFPRGWTEGFSRSRRRIMLGNAVTVPVAKWLGKRILETENAK